MDELTFIMFIAGTVAAWYAGRFIGHLIAIAIYFIKNR